MYKDFYLHVCMCTMCIQCPKNPYLTTKNWSDRWLSHHVGSGKQTQVLYKSNKCSYHWAIFPAPTF